MPQNNKKFISFSYSLRAASQIKYLWILNHIRLFACTFCWCICCGTDFCLNIHVNSTISFYIRYSIQMLKWFVEWTTTVLRFSLFINFKPQFNVVALHHHCLYQKVKLQDFSSPFCENIKTRADCHLHLKREREKENVHFFLI